MEQPAPVRDDLLEPVRRRWSPRRFADRPVPPDELRAIFLAGTWAASSFHEPPWRWIAARRHEEPDLFERVFSCLSEGNRKWAGRTPVLGLTFVKRRFDRNDKPNRVAEHDLGQAMATLALEAMSRDLFVHQMAGVDLDAVRKAFDPPEGFDPFTAVAVGYGVAEEDLDPEALESERKDRRRRPLEEVAFGGKWGEPAGFVGRGAG